MNKKRFIFLLCTLCALLYTTAFAKTHKTEIVAIDTIEYTLEEEDKLSAELFIDEDGLYEVKVISLSTSGNSSPRIAIRVFESNNEIYSFVTDKKRNIEGTEPESYGFLIGLVEGEYKVEVENLSMFSDVTFKLETTFTEEENLESFNNDSFESASEIEIGEKYFGSATMYDEVDYFRFEMPYDGVAYIQMYTPEAKFFTLYDEGKNEIGYIGIEIEEADKIYELRSGLAKGTYYISVKPDEDYCAPLYTIKVESTKVDYFESEYNNDTDNAIKIESGKEYQGNLFGVEDKDVFTFTLGEDSKVTIDFFDTVVSKDGHYGVWLKNEKDTVFSSDECGREALLMDLAKGTYYFGIESLGYKHFTSMGYKLNIKSDKGFADAKVEAPNENKQEEIIQFADVTQDKWYYNELLEAKKLGLIEGVGENRYNPTGNVTLAEAITMAVRIKNALGGANTEITPSPVGKWYNSYITFAVNSGIIKMNDFDDFERNATRAEVAYIFANVLGDADASKNTNIPDVNEDTKFRGEIHKLYALGILKGDSDGSFRPDDSITRAEAAAILLRVHKNS